MGCHYMDLPFWALDLRHPVSCQAEGPEVHPETCPLGLIVKYKFPQRGDLPPVDLTWYDGDKTPREVAGERVPGSGVMFIGSEGNLFSTYTSYKLFPKEKFSDFTPPEESIPDSIGHHAEWIKACKDGSPTLCNFDYSGALSEAVLLGNVAYRSRQTFGVGRQGIEGHQLPRGRHVHPKAVSTRLGSRTYRLISTFELGSACTSAASRLDFRISRFMASHGSYERQQNRG